MSLVSALASETVRARREDRRRWDRDRLAAAIEFPGAAQDAGDQYRRGRAASDPSIGADERFKRDSEARQALCALWVAATKAKLLLPYAQIELQAVSDTARSIRDLADEGIQASDQRWKERRAAHQRAIDAFSEACRFPLGIGDHPDAPASQELR